MLLYLSNTDSDDTLKVTTNQTAVCLGDYYYLFCVSDEPFGEICSHSTADWHRSADDKIVHSNSTHMVSIANDTAVVLKFLITNQAQTFYCTSNRCMSNVVSVGEDNITSEFRTWHTCMMLPCEQTKAKYMSNYCMCTCCQEHEDMDYNKYVCTPPL